MIVGDQENTLKHEYLFGFYRFSQFLIYLNYWTFSTYIEQTQYFINVNKEQKLPNIIKKSQKENILGKISVEIGNMFFFYSRPEKNKTCCNIFTEIKTAILE